jgi:hypothetical protein
VDRQPNTAPERCGRPKSRIAPYTKQPPNARALIRMKGAEIQPSQQLSESQRSSLPNQSNASQSTRCSSSSSSSVQQPSHIIQRPVTLGPYLSQNQSASSPCTYLAPGTPSPSQTAIQHAVQPGLSEIAGSQISSIDNELIMSDSPIRGVDHDFFRYDPRGARTTRTARVSEKAAYAKLERLARQQFLCSLSNTNVEQPVKATFPFMSPNHRDYQYACRRVRDLYKTWKNRSLKCAEDFFEQWLMVPGNESHRTVTSFQLLKDALLQQYSDSWVLSVFPWAHEAFSVDECSQYGRKFLQCKFTFLNIFIVQTGTTLTPTC